MKFKTYSSGASSFKTPLMVVPAFERGERAELPGGFNLPARAGKDYGGKFRSGLLVYNDKPAKAERTLFLGCGKKNEFTAEKARRWSALAYQKARELKLTSYALFLDKGMKAKISDQELGGAISAGTILGGYSFNHYKTDEKGKPIKEEGPKQAHLFASGAKFRQGLEWERVCAESTCYSRDLGNLPSNNKYPRLLAKEGRELASASSRITCRVYDEKQVAKMKMGAFLGVARGSSEPPRLVILHYKPRGRARKRVCLVGKGITFDTGGISIKPSAAMDEMKFDMCGAAAVFGVFHALAYLDIPHEVIGLTPFTENMPGGNAQKPGDICKAVNGKTIEVLNTDAEGRLILADALAYASKTYEPDAMIDLATLTGAVVHGLGHEVSAAMGNSQAIISKLIEAGNRTGENVWQLPLLDAHKEAMKSKVADLKNISGGGVGAGSSTAGAFLSNFVGDTPWVHLDIAGSAWGAKDRDYYKQGAAGVGVRLLIDFLKNY